LPNHFHFLIQVKPYPDLLKYYKIIKPHGKGEEGWQPDFVMQQFSNLLNSYAKSFNIKNNRKGALFMDYLRRVEVTNEGHFSSTVFYIHKNAVHHGYCKAISEWHWSSYNCILKDTPTNLQWQKVLQWFGGTEKFIEYHKQQIYLKNAAVVEYENL
jgi:putative transposase